MSPYISRQELSESATTLAQRPTVKTNGNGISRHLKCQQNGSSNIILKDIEKVHMTKVVSLLEVNNNVYVHFFDKILGYRIMTIYGN
jgi:hypothetical protein